MALKESTSTATLVINNVAVAYIAGTLTYDLGNAEKRVRVETGGGGSVQRVSSIDVTTQFSTVKFQLTTRPENDKLYESWIKNNFNNSISITDRDVAYYGSNAGITTKAEISTGVDGVIDVEFQCDSFIH